MEYGKINRNIYKAQQNIISTHTYIQIHAYKYTDGQRATVA